MATPLHNHTHASALDGLSKPSEIAERCQQLGFGSVACTDHDVVAGHYEFYTTIRDAELKPILGVETYQTIGSRQVNLGFRTDPTSKEKADNFHLILLAMNNEGLRNLYSMNSEAHATGFYFNGRIDWDLLEKYSDGLICTSACGLSLLSSALRGNSYAGDADAVMNRYLDIFGDRFYVELSTYTEQWSQDLNTQLVDIARQYGVPMVYANDAHYAFPGQYKLHETVLCMQYGEKVSQRTEPHHSPDLYIMSEQEIDRSLGYLPTSVIQECIENTEDIASKCNVTLDTPRKRVPVFIPESKWATSREMLFDLAVEGYQKLVVEKGLSDDLYMPRFREEIQAIYKADLVDYLLIVRDYVDYARRKGYLVGPGRGSVGGSLVAYCLEIHQVDPIKYGLMFERFYNIGREGKMPDIDSDFPTFARDDIKAYLAKKYGADYVAEIGNHSQFQGRAAIKKLGMALETPYTTTEKISKIIESAIESGQQPKWKDIWEKKGNELASLKQQEPLLFDYAEQLHGRTNNYGVHASGVLVGDEPLAPVFPLRWHAKDKKLVTQWDMRIAEKLGFMKMDILGLRNLDGLMEYCEIINTPVEEFYKLVDIEDKLPDEMWELVDRGFTVGIFQIEDGNDVKRMCRDIKPRNLEDIALITALNRPGPLKSGSDRRYIKARNGGTVYYRHPIFETIAKDTYGEVIYQEQFIRFFVELGYDPKQADIIRDIVGKKKRDEMAKIKPDFIQRFLSHPGSDSHYQWLERTKIDGTHINRDKVLTALAEEIWSDLNNFADYAFNKAHSVEYGLITLWTIWAKWNHPAAFYIGAMRSLIKAGKKEQTHRYIREAQRMGIEILKPDINRSNVTTDIDGDAIRYGFADVKGIGLSPAKWIVQNRPFQDFDDLQEKSLEDNRKITLKNGMRKVGINSGQIGALRRLHETPSDHMADVEEELLGIALSDPSVDVLNEYADEIDKLCVSFEEAEEPGQHTIAGIITEVKEATTRKGDPMLWVTLDNSGETKRLAVFGKNVKTFQFVWRQRQAVVVKISVNDRGQNVIDAKPLYSKKNKVD